MFRFACATVLCLSAVSASAVTLFKSFNVTGPIAPTGTTTLTFTLTKSSSEAPQTNLGFADQLPSGLLFDGIVSNNCGGGGSFSSDQQRFTFFGGQLLGPPLGASTCKIEVRVKATGMCGLFENGPGNLTGLSPALDPGTHTAVLAVVGCGGGAPPVLAKAFQPQAIAANSNATLVFTITNAAGNPEQNGVTFTDALPGGLIATGIVSKSCLGSVDITTNPHNVAYTGKLAPGQSSCQIVVAVRAPAQCGHFVNGPAQITASTNLDISKVNAAFDVTGCQASQGVTLRKIVDGAPAGFQGAFSFLVQCTTPAGFYQKIFPAQFPSPGFVSIADIPPGSSCTVTEGPLAPPPSGYNWSGLPAINPAGVITIGSNTVITITNTLRSCTESGKVTVRAVLQGVPQNFSGVFSGTLQCWSGGVRTTYPITLTAPNALSTAVTNLPLGSTCTFVETSQPALPANLQWNTPTIVPPFGSVTLDNECCREITVTNAARTCCTVDGVTTCNVSPGGGN